MPSTPPSNDAANAMLTLDCYGQFSSNSIRDLAWLLFSPAVFECPLGPYSAFDFQLDHARVMQWLHDEDVKVTTDASSIPSRESFRRLGLYSEALLHYFFSQSDSYKLCPFKIRAHNLQIFRDGKTLGELDLLLEDSASKLFHTELAVKFYLQVASGKREWKYWVGPNSIDRLDIKCERMIEHQLSLPSLYPLEVGHSIKNHLGDNSIKKKTAQPFSLHLIKGLNFVHYKDIKEACLPERSNSVCPIGCWAKLSELKNTPEALINIFPNGSRTYVVDKMGWMTGNAHEEEKQPLSESLTVVENLFKNAHERGYPTPGVMIFFEDDVLADVAFNKTSNTTPNSSHAQIAKAPNGRLIAKQLIVVGDDWPFHSQPS